MFSLSKFSFSSITLFDGSFCLKESRVLSKSVKTYLIPNSLKKLYECRCQICGARAIEMYNVDISEAHHIELFSKTANNNASNILIVCPDHHRIIHKAKPVFKRELLRFEYENGKNDELMYNFHL